MEVIFRIFFCFLFTGWLFSQKDTGETVTGKISAVFEWKNRGFMFTYINIEGK